VNSEKGIRILKGGNMAASDWWLALQTDLEEAQARLDKLEGISVEPRLRFAACSSLKLAYTPGMSLCARKLSLVCAVEALTEIEDSLKQELIQ
jgi:hypothetical protein